MHLSLSDEVHTFNLNKEKKFLSYVEESQTKQDIRLFCTMDIETEIADVANQGDYDLLLVGLGKSILKVPF
jgi:hypothetical protein